MPTLAHLAVDMSHVTEILEVAHKILRRNRDHDLVQKIMILQGYAELGGNESRPHLRRHDSESLPRFDGARPSDG